MNKARVLKIRLNTVDVGYITYFIDGKSFFTFDESYIERGAARPMLSLAFTDPKNEENTENALREIYSSMMRLPPYFSNLLPEGALRKYLVKKMKIHHDHEFFMLEALGDNLSGAVIAEPVDTIPDTVIQSQVRNGANLSGPSAKPLPFALAGAQLKFSMIENGGRFSFGNGDGEWIVKPPHPTFAAVPANEFTMMKLAEAAGVEIPDVRLVPIKDLDLGNLEELNIPRGEEYAYAIRRYDRNASGRVHAEDFAQVFNVYGDKEYTATNYDSMGKLIFAVFPNRHAQIEQFIRRLVVNILVGNADAHLKNSSIIYKDGTTPSLSPAYDIVSTIEYTKDYQTALNLGKEKSFYAFKKEHFERFARRIGLPEKVAIEIVQSTMKDVNAKWKETLSSMSISNRLRDTLKTHWEQLDPFIRPQIPMRGVTVLL